MPAQPPKKPGVKKPPAPGKKPGRKPHAPPPKPGPTPGVKPPECPEPANWPPTKDFVIGKRQ